MQARYDVSATQFAAEIDYETMSEDEAMFSSQMFAALGNVTRLRIADLLIEGERTVNEVAQMLRIQQPNASLNLSILARAGIVKMTPQGNQRCYSLRGPRIVHLLILAKQFADRHASAVSLENATDGG